MRFFGFMTAPEFARFPQKIYQILQAEATKYPEKPYRFSRLGIVHGGPMSLARLHRHSEITIAAPLHCAPTTRSPRSSPCHLDVGRDSGQAGRLPGLGCNRIQLERCSQTRRSSDAHIIEMTR
jgi:hypothetical protein